MEKLFIARHGHYDKKSGKLTYEGWEQMDALAKEVKAGMGSNESVLVLFSPLPRTVESGKIVKDFLGSTLEEDETLDEVLQRKNAEPAYQNILKRRDEIDVLVVITHFYMANKIRDLIVKKFNLKINLNPDFINLGLGNGCAWKIDFEKLTLDRVRPKIDEL